jgi:hypothetical protein
MVHSHTEETTMVVQCEHYPNLLNNIMTAHPENK